MNRKLKYITALIFLGAIILAFYLYQTSEKWPSTDRCETCSTLENSPTLKRFSGTISIDTKGNFIFQEEQTAKKYTLLPCDFNCTGQLKKGLIANSKLANNNKPIQYDLEGTINGNEFHLLNYILMD